MKKFVALIFCAFFLINITPSFAQTGTCECALGDNNRWYVVEPNNCGSMNPTNCDGGLPGVPHKPNCVCKPLPTSSHNPVNTCGCSPYGSATWSNCQGSTRRASCYWVTVPYAEGYFGCKCDPGYEVTPTPVPIIPPYKPDSYLCDDGLSVNTALGCVPVQMDKFIAWLLPKLFGISGGIAFLLMVYGFILITTSNGDPKAVQGAKETITSAVIGLLISIFAIFILRLIAIDILHIPGIS